MITPAHFDLLMAFSAVLIGVYVLVVRLKVANDCAGTPMLEVAIVCAGALSWAVFGILAISILFDYPAWHTDDYHGRWDYTVARALSFVMWLLAMRLISQYSSFMMAISKQDNTQYLSED